MSEVPSEFSLGIGRRISSVIAMGVFKFRNLNSGQAMPIPDGEFLIGRADDAYVHLEDPSVSRRHARLVNSEHGLFVEDLGSGNGTALRGAFIDRPMQVEIGEVVHIGSVPFRIDPEVAGEITPPVGARPANRTYLTRDTERIPASGIPRVVEAIAPDKLAAPEISASSSMDAEELNAIKMTDPKSIAPQPRTSVTTPRVTSTPAPSAVSIPTPARSSATISAPTASGEASRPAANTQLNPPVPVEIERPWTAWIVIFLAGLGLGLLLGLYFAKVFIEMGGHPSSLL